MNQYEIKREPRRSREIREDLQLQELERFSRELERERVAALSPDELEAEELGVSLSELKALKDCGPNFFALWQEGAA